MIPALLILAAVTVHPVPANHYQQVRVEYAEAMRHYFCGSQHYDKLFCDWFRLQAKRERAIQEARK